MKNIEYLKSNNIIPLMVCSFYRHNKHLYSNSMNKLQP